MILELGSQGEEVKAAQRILNVLHFRGRKKAEASADFDALEVDGIFGTDTEDAIVQFQEFSGIYTDGRVGPVTLAALQDAYGSRQIELAAPLAIPDRDQLSVVRGPADRFGKGYDAVHLRSDVMAAYRAVYDEVHRQGGLLTSSGGIRSLDAKVGPNQSATSFHYSGRALDLMIYSGMQDPKTDPYVVQRLGERRYRVFARCTQDHSASRALPPRRKVDNVVTHKSRVKGVSVTDHFLDLTQLFEQHDFKPIRARPAFENGGNYLGAEWWHFQCVAGLIPGVTTFGSELLKIYSESHLKTKPPWKYRDYIFGKNWN